MLELVDPPIDWDTHPGLWFRESLSTVAEDVMCTLLLEITLSIFQFFQKICATLVALQNQICMEYVPDVLNRETY